MSESDGRNARLCYQVSKNSMFGNHGGGKLVLYREKDESRLYKLFSIIFHGNFE